MISLRLHRNRALSRVKLERGEGFVVVTSTLCAGLENGTRRITSQPVYCVAVVEER